VYLNNVAILYTTAHQLLILRLILLLLQLGCVLSAQDDNTITSGQSNMTTGHIPAAREWFSGLHQVAPVCTPPNTCFLGPTRVQIPNSMSICSAIFAQLTTEGPYTLQRAAPSPLKISTSHEGYESHLTNGSFDPPQSSTQTASRSVQPFLRGSQL